MMKEMMRAKILSEATLIMGEMSFSSTKLRQITDEMTWKKKRFVEGLPRKPAVMGSLQIKSTTEI